MSDKITTCPWAREASLQALSVMSKGSTVNATCIKEECAMWELTTEPMPGSIHVLDPETGKIEVDPTTLVISGRCRRTA